MLAPRKMKHRKTMRGSMRGLAQSGNRLAFGKYGIKALDRGWVTAAQLEAARRAMTRHVKRGGKIWIRVFPDKPITQKASEVPMGSGKGNPVGFVTVVKPGHVLFEMDGVEQEVGLEALRLATHKLPVRTKIIQRELED